MAKQLTIAGRVQGVGYRASFAEQAVALGLTGWVRNCRDGTVLACITGEPAAMAAIVQWASHGPPAAQVRHVAIEEVATGSVGGDSFQILSTR
jgi:acylphosphatase